MEKVAPPMPELPEVETVMRGMAPAIEGRRIVAAEIRRPDLRWPFPKDMAARLTGQRVLGLRRRSKYILADLSSGETLLIHLGMSGRVTVAGKAPGIFVHDHAAAAKHDHVVLEFEGDVATPLSMRINFIRPILKATSKSIDVRVGFEGLVPFWSGGNRLAAAYDRNLFDGFKLKDIVEAPEFVFCATNLQTGGLFKLREASHDKYQKP